MSLPIHRLVGLTGGIGSGKSTVAQLLHRIGAHVVDADEIARSITQPGGPALLPIAQAFGRCVLLADGTLNRAALREKVFKDASARLQLEAITHPLIAQGISDSIAQHPQGILILDIPLLVESPRWRKRLDAVVVVDCSEATQTLRIRRRNGWAEEVIVATIRAQAQRHVRLCAADAVIYNEGHDLSTLHAQVVQLARWLGL